MSERAISWLFVTECRKCPCEYDGTCAHPDTRGDADVPDALGDVYLTPPPECPLRKQALCIALPRDV